MLPRLIPILALITLGACTTAVPQSTPQPPPRQPVPDVPATNPRPVQPTNPNDPRVMTVPGLEAVIGVNANTLINQFGSPRLDVREGDVRKLQFGGNACVLDIYLYPSSRSREPLATWVEARRASDGLDVDRAACVAALRTR